VRSWQREDTEAVTCCVCHREGRPIYDLDPFGVVRCPRCDVVFVSPRLVPEALQQVYEDLDYFEGEGGVYGIAKRWSPGMFLQRRWTSGRLDLAASESGREPAGARLLEIGCAYGFFLDAARTRGYDVAGVELSKGAADHAREALGLSVFSGQLEDAPFDGRFDVICAWDTLEHVPDPVAFWRAVRTLIAEDGVILFSTPYFSSLPSRLLRERWWTLKPTEHIWHFTPKTHRTVAAEADLRVIRTIRNPIIRSNFARLDSLVGVARPA
jgi:2-polyprenyl-3-methyl-5-hydroxy-6-metoxy-1,4-benzoquinol methylase